MSLMKWRAALYLRSVARPATNGSTQADERYYQKRVMLSMQSNPNQAVPRLVITQSIINSGWRSNIGWVVQYKSDDEREIRLTKCRKHFARRMK